MKIKLLLALCLVISTTINLQAATQPLRVFIRAGVKTHGPGAHDHPRFLKEWTTLLNQRGAKTTGALEFPTASQLKATDVLIMYAANAGDIDPTQRKNLNAFFKRGGGIVVIHDAVCGNDSQWFKTITGGAWEHKYSKFRHGDMTLDYTKVKHPITKGAKDFSFPDEIYWQLHMMDDSKVLAVSPTTDGQTGPQMWVYEKDNARAFVSIPGHYHVSFNLPQYRAILLRGIAWAGQRDVDSMLNKRELAALANPPAAPPIHHEPKPAKKSKPAAKKSVTLTKLQPNVAAQQKAPPKRPRKPAPPVYTGPARQFPWGEGTRILIVGGNKAHDFDTWFNKEDIAILTEDGNASVFYTDHTVDIIGALDKIDVLYLSNNQPFPNPKTREAIMKFAARGNGLILAHAALWYNFKDWPAYNQNLVGGGTRKHDKLGPFQVDILKPNHPVMKGVPKNFAVTDELYHFIPDPNGAPIQVLSQSTSPITGTTYPSTFIVKHPKARIVCITLGHDGDCHNLPAFRTMLKNAIKWAANK